MRVIVLALLLLMAPSLRAAEPLPERSERLAALGRVWGAVAFLHPWIWTRTVDWDSALLKALPRARAATTEDELALAVSDMLAALHDPVTRVVPTQAPPPRAHKTTPLVEWPRPGVLLVRLGSTEALAAPSQTKIAAELAKARSVIFDMRTDSPEVAGAQPNATPLYEQLLRRVVYLPSRRFVVHDGYRPQRGPSSGGYTSGLQVTPADAFEPDKAARPRRAVFIVDNGCDLPDVGIGMQAIGDAAFVAVGDMSLEELTAGARIPIGEHHAVQLRTSEWMPVPGTAAPRIDAALPASADEATVLKTALALTSPPREHARPAAPLPPLVWHHDPFYEEMKAPDLDHRLLALFRLWNVIDRFYPYKALLDDRWDDLLPQFVARFETAEGADGYAEAVAELATHVVDCHTGVYGTTDAFVSTQAPPPFLARMIEGQPVVVRILDDEAGRELRPGDAIVTLDGEPFATRLSRVRRYVACSTDGARELFTLRRALSGAEGSTLQLTVRGSDGKTRSVGVVRHKKFYGAGAAWRSGDVVRILDGNIGYVDLDRLTVPEVDAMFDKLKDTRAIIFDMRGYPHTTAWHIAPRLNVRHATDAAMFERPIVGSADWTAWRHKFIQPLPTTTKALYRGKTFMLVDERTISQSEHTGLFFEVAAGTRFIGSQSAGANGDVTSLVLPGGLTVTFTGHDVRHADGRQLQRVGLPLDVRVTPTLRGVQAGRDEVLERALQLAHAAK